MTENLCNFDLSLIFFPVSCQSCVLWMLPCAVCNLQTSVWCIYCVELFCVFVGNRLVHNCGPSPTELCTPCQARRFTVRPKDLECSPCTQCVGMWTGHPGFFFFSLFKQTSNVLKTEGEFLVFNMYRPLLTPLFLTTPPGGAKCPVWRWILWTLMLGGDVTFGDFSLHFKGASRRNPAFEQGISSLFFQWHYPWLVLNVPPNCSCR